MSEKIEQKNLHYYHLQPLAGQFKHKFVNRAIDQGASKLRARKAKSNLRNGFSNNINAYGFWNPDALKNNFVLS